MRILLTGAGGFLGWHTRVRLRAVGGHEVVPVVTAADWDDAGVVDHADVDAVVHVAGVNRGDPPTTCATATSPWPGRSSDALPARAARAPDRLRQLRPVRQRHAVRARQGARVATCSAEAADARRTRLRRRAAAQPLRRARPAATTTRSSQTFVCRGDRRGACRRSTTARSPLLHAQAGGAVPDGCARADRPSAPRRRRACRRRCRVSSTSCVSFHRLVRHRRHSPAGDRPRHGPVQHPSRAAVPARTIRSALTRRPITGASLVEMVRAPRRAGPDVRVHDASRHHPGRALPPAEGGTVRGRLRHGPDQACDVLYHDEVITFDVDGERAGGRRHADDVGAQHHQRRRRRTDHVVLDARALRSRSAGHLPGARRR